MDAHGFRSSEHVDDHRGHPTLTALMGFFGVPYPQDFLADLKQSFADPWTPLSRTGGVPNTPGGVPEQAGINDLQRRYIDNPVNTDGDLPVAARPFGSLVP